MSSIGKFRGIGRWITASAMLIGTCFVLSSASAQMMSVPGKFDVNAMGAATYSIPLAVPPGTAEMVPALSLDYSSQSGDGIVGMGWTLSGLPSIGRCPKTIAQDGAIAGVGYLTTDVFCMEGQRLVATSGTYGADGTVYHTEIEGFTKIISHGTAGNGPAWFEVHTKSGQIMELGHTTDSAILAYGISTVRTWAVDKISDTKSNYFTVTYTSNGAGLSYPTEIDYTGNTATSLSPYNKVTFVYNTSRTDPSTIYQAGSQISTTVLLTDVKTYQGTNLVTDTKLTYAQGTGTNRSHLTSATICDSSGTTCLPATNLSWSDTSSPGTFTAVTSNTTPSSLAYTPYFGDFNGDGKLDIFWCQYASASYCSSNSAAHIWMSNGDGTFTSVNVPTNTPTGQFMPMVADFNGDGKADIYWCNPQSSNMCNLNSATHVWFSNGDGSFTSATSTTNTPSGPSGSNAAMPMFGDFNGDGRTDIFWCIQWSTSNKACNSNATSYVYLSNGDGTFTSVTSNATPSPTLSYRPYLADFNGDGLTDIFWCHLSDPTASDGCAANLATIVWLSKGDGTFTSVTSNTTPTSSQYMPLIGDLNGDGKADIFLCIPQGPSDCTTNSATYAWMSKGDGTFVSTSSTNTPTFTGGAARPFFADYNGDGRSDIFWCAPGSTSSTSCNNGLATYVYLGKGDGTFRSVTSFTTPSSLGYMPMIGDFSGDGLADIFFCHPSSSAPSTCNNSTATLAYLTVEPASYATSNDALGVITPGSGAATTVTYKPLTNSSVYTKGAGAGYPTQDYQGPMSVVSRVDANNGAGGTYSSTYTYSYADIDLSGRGFLGFRGVTITDLQTGLIQATAYMQPFPCTGLVKTRLKYSGPTYGINSTFDVYQMTNAGGTSVLVGQGAGVCPGGIVSTPSMTSAPYTAALEQSQEFANDLDGSVMPTVTTTYVYDAYGNPTSVTVGTPDGASKVTTNTYTNDTTNWYLGRLTGSTVTSTTP